MKSLFLGLLASGTLQLCPISLHAQDTTVAQRLARDLVPRVEQAVGLRFKRQPVVVLRSRDQLRAYLDRKLAQEYPPQEMRGIERTYHAFGFVDDTTSVRHLLIDVLTEQVAGFYDPDSSRLFVIRGGDPQLLRGVMAHELVHALQDQYTRLNDILKSHGQNDRQSAGQSVFEGQAMIGMVRALQPGVTDEQLTAMFEGMRRALQSPPANMPQIARAPRFITAGLVFPYSDGGAFVLAWEARRTDDTSQPFGAALPVSTEQVLHPTRYVARDVPRRVRFDPPAPGDTVVHEDDLGEFETREALSVWGVGEDLAAVAAAGWNGDRFRLLGTPAGTSVIWASAWDSDADAADFERRLRGGWATRAARMRDAAARHYQIDRLTVGGVSVVRLVDAPNAWGGWQRLPLVRLPR